MSQCVAFNTDGALIQSTQSVTDCTGYILISPTEYDLMIQTVEITPTEILTVFATVFGWVVFLGYLSYQVKIGKRTIGKAQAITNDAMHQRRFKMGEIFAAVDLGTVAAFIAATGVIIIGIAMGEKGVTIGKRNVKKA